MNVTIEKDNKYHVVAQSWEINCTFCGEPTQAGSRGCDITDYLFHDGCEKKTGKVACHREMDWRYFKYGRDRHNHRIISNLKVKK